jgi:hypothetical protein
VTPRDSTGPSETLLSSLLVDASTIASGSTDVPVSGLDDKAKPPVFI